jgi:hypothetical protein
VGRWKTTPDPFRQHFTKFARDINKLRCERTVPQPARVVSATTDVPGHTVRIETVEEGRVYRLALYPDSGWRAGEWSGELRIKTDDPEQPLLVVPVTLFVGTARAPK